ncbi:efflux RND transporter permease subunit [Paraglaciecola sp. 2405UD69-4]|uniref:efflux RND transporter permease subunit n=1 Tax=Paraglaciecola sp. 2405UD69-4 TaxID=3391836 RepID=UPI0039C9C185
MSSYAPQNSTQQVESSEPKQTGLIAYFANNSVAANMMMMFIIIIGIWSYMTIPRQMFPNIEINYISINSVYRGASPQEIEESILVKIEESLKDVTEIKKIISNAYRGNGRIILEIDNRKELTDVLDKVKAKVDGIATFPAAMEPPQIAQIEFQQDVIEMAIVGDVPISELKPIAKKIEDELLQLSNISLVEVDAPEDEIAIEVNPETLRKYSLTIDDITQAIRGYSANISAGQLRTDAGIIAVRVENQLYDGNEFRQIPVKIGNNGAKVLLEDVAEIKDGFVEGERYFKFSGQNGVYISVKATKDQNTIPIADSVKKYVEAKNATLPQGLSLETMVDFTFYLNARLDMMLNNLFQGSILVAIMLTIFLRFRLAFWVMIGLPICFLGAMMMMPVFGITINVMSLFAFIMVLGIVVDDAIVIGESAYSEIEKSGGGTESVIRGAKRVATPATFGVLTTIAIFTPSLFSTGPEGAFFINISTVVILCLIFSLIESKWILPAHLANMKFTPVKETSWRTKFNKAFFGFVNGPYKNFIERCIQWRWLAFSIFIALLLISAGLIQGNYVRTVPSPKVAHDYPSINIEMNENVSDLAVIEALQLVENTILEIDADVVEKYGSPLIRDIMVLNSERTKGRMIVALVDEQDRHFDAFELARRWRENMPVIPGLKSLTIVDDILNNGDSGDEFGFMLFGANMEQLNAAGRQFITMLQQQEGLFDISSSIDPPGKEIQLDLLPVAYDLGLTLSDVASQVSASFFGGEAQRVIRASEEVRVMVRYPALTRERFADLKYTVITTPQGREVMLGDVATLTEKAGINFIRREAGYRSVYIFGSIDEELVEPNEVIGKVEDELLPQLKSNFPGVKSELGGTIEEQQAQEYQQMTFFIIGLLMIFILLAVPLKSYGQPLIIMSVIPFSFTGAIWGHLLFGLDLSLMSLFGLIAAAGVVINDSLVMTDFVNQRRKQGHAIKVAVTEAGCARFRAITLTSITTFAGVLPIMFETSSQAKLVVPMAVSLGFAVLYATLVTLVLVPCLYMILEDMKAWFVWTGSKLKLGYTKIFRRNIEISSES